MDRLIYTAMTGANAAANRQAIVANNLANVSTSGFRAQLSTYRAVPVRGDGATTRVDALEATSGYLDTPGPAQRTDRALDVMPVGKSWLAVQGLDGTEAYTRSGNLEVSSDGTITTGNGLPLLSSGGAPLVVPQGAQVSIGNDGSVSAKIGNQPINVIGRMKLVTAPPEERLQRSGDGLFRTQSGDPLENDGAARVQPGVLEGSNVNAIETMVSMIQTARQFDTQMRLLQTAESNDRAAGQLLNVQG